MHIVKFLPAPSTINMLLMSTMIHHHCIVFRQSIVSISMGNTGMAQVIILYHFSRLSQEVNPEDNELRRVATVMS